MRMLRLVVPASISRCKALSRRIVSDSVAGAIGAAKDLPSREELPQDISEGPDIGGSAVVLAFQHFLEELARRQKPSAVSENK